MSAHVTSWSGPSTIVDAVRRKWDTGALLRELHLDPDGRATFPLRVKLVGPTRDDLAERFPAASAWARELQQAAATTGWELVTRRARAGLATHDLPVAAIVPTPELGLTMLGRDKAVAARRFAVALNATGRLGPDARQFALARPLDILGAGEDWSLLLELAAWVRHHPRPGIYPRQIPVAGVHTKVIEQHRPLLSRLLDVVLPEGAVDASAAVFATRYGFLSPARRVRLRGDAQLLGVPGEGPADVVWDVAALAALDPDADKVIDLLVVENQVSFLTAPLAPGRLVVWGAGYGADELLAAVPWVSRPAVAYWGDIDTHGFAILDRVRRVAPQTRSVLMDTATLLGHRQFWVLEKTPRITDLTALTPPEAELYQALCVGVYGDRIRLEQEFINYDLVSGALTKVP